MPIYVYKCKACLREFEEVQKFSDEPLRKCPSCKKMKLVRVISGSGLVFKGSGFYLTDYKKRSTSESESSPPAETTEKRKEGSPGDAKGEGKNDVKATGKNESKRESDSKNKSAEKSSTRKKK